MLVQGQTRGKTTGFARINNQASQPLRPWRGRGSRWTSVTVTLGLMVEPQLACQKQNIKIKGHDLATILAADKKHPVGIPVELPGALEALRRRFQTRGVINLKIDSDKISPSSSFKLVNKATGATLIKTSAGASGLAGDPAEPDQAWSLQDNGYDFTLNIYPLDPHFTGKFAYGPNDLLLNVDEQTSPKDANKSVTMQDFEYFASVYSSFEANEQQQENFQGEVVTVTGPFVSNGDYEISNSMVAMLNR